jgi:hypothetical protein
MPNTNCLEGIKCTACGNEDRFRIAAKTTAIVGDNGVEDYDGMEWGDDSHTECADCTRHGSLKDFKAE